VGTLAINPVHLTEQMCPYIFDSQRLHLINENHYYHRKMFLSEQAAGVQAWLTPSCWQHMWLQQWK